MRLIPLNTVAPAQPRILNRRSLLRAVVFPVLLAMACSMAVHRVQGADVQFLGAVSSAASNNYAPQNWSSPSGPKEFALEGSQVYGTAGYYQIRPVATNSSTEFAEPVGATNNLGISAAADPTLSSAPVILSSITGGAGNYVNFASYPTFLGPDGSTIYRQGSLSVSAGTGPNNTPSGTNNGYFGQAFSFTTAMSATFRVGIAVGTADAQAFAPDYVSIFNTSTGTKFSTLLVRDTTPDMAFFEIDAVAGETFTAAVWQLAGSNSVAPFGLITFDVVSYNFNIAAGLSETNSVPLGGAPSRLHKTGQGTLVLAASNSCGGGVLVEEGALAVVEGGAINGLITNNASMLVSVSELLNVISGSGSLTKAGPALSVLWSSNSYTGATVVEGGALRLDGAGAISSASTLHVASGALFSATGLVKETNDLTIAGLTGDGQFYNKNGNLTVAKAAGTNTFAGSITGDTGLTKSGGGNFVLAGSNSYTGVTTIEAGRIVLVNSSGLGATSSGTVVTGGAQLRLSPTNSGLTLGDEALVISGDGISPFAGGALRNAAGNNTWQGKITLTSNSGIGSAGGTSLTLDVASGDAIDLAGFTLTIDGAGSTQVNDGIAGTGGIVKIGNGTTTLAGNNTYTGATEVDLGALVVSNTSLSATISPTSVSVDFASTPVTGATYTVLSGALATNSFASTPVVNGLGSGQTATLTNNPNLVVLVSGSPATNNYASWLTNYPSLTGAATNGSADPDGDGFINDTEYAFDGDPTVGTPALMTATAVGTNAVFNWIERTNGVTYEVQKNGTLTNAWTSTGIIGVVASDQSGVLLPPEYVRKQFSTNASGKDFYRVRATFP